MEVIIEEKKDNPLLGRIEIKGTLKFDGITPSNVKLAEALAKELGCEIEFVVMKSIYTKYSHQEAAFLAFVYKNKEAKDKIEMVTKHMKKKAEAVAKKAAEEKNKVEEANKIEKKSAPEEVSKEEASTSKEEVSTSKEEVSTSKEEASTSKEEVSTSKEEVSIPKEEASKEEEKA